MLGCAGRTASRLLHNRYKFIIKAGVIDRALVGIYTETVKKFVSVNDTRKQ